MISADLRDGQPPLIDSTRTTADAFRTPATLLALAVALFRSGPFFALSRTRVRIGKLFWAPAARLGIVQQAVRLLRLEVPVARSTFC